MKKWPDKDPDAVLDFGVDWSEFLQLPAPDTIAVSDWIMPANAATSIPPLVKSLDSWTPLITTIWLQGGQAGESYKVTNRITTVAGRVEDLTVRLKVREQ